MSRTTLDLGERISMFQEVKPGLLVELPWDKITIEGTMYYEPTGGQTGGLAPNGLRQRGVLVAQEIFTHPAPAVPVAPRLSGGQFAVWQLGSI
jgi:hypothetical protein